jgi:DNA repair photolyase
MEPDTPLFPVEFLRPTTRDVARVVRDGGADALVGAEWRADHARYQEVHCRSALNRVEGMPFRWTLNPYRGCTHACHYCFARRYHTQFELDADDEFASVILVKRNLVSVLERGLTRPTWQREVVAVGTATDPYQPIEGHYALTRRALEALGHASTPVGIVTKGPLIVRDIDVLRALSERASCSVYVSVPSVDEDAWRRLEPGTAPPLQRLRAVKTLVDAGIRAGVLMAPLVPGITTHPKIVARTVAAIAEHGAQFVGANLLFLEGGTRTHFLAFLEREYPELSERYGSLYAGGKRADAAYAAEVRAMVRGLQERAGLRRSEYEDRAAEAKAARDAARELAASAPARNAASCTQPRFRWDDDRDYVP